jgi:vacuolar-type H+-ATPase subunit E/Vma4
MVIRADGRVRLDMTFQGLLERQRDDLRAEVARRLWGS